MGRHTKRVFGAALALGALLGCSNVQVMSQVVRARAVNDLQCPREQLNVTDLGIQTYGVRGCKMKATYTVRGECTEYANCTAVLNPESLRHTK